MAKAFASEKNAIGICDRCGFEYPLKELRKEGVNLNVKHVRVCPECWDDDHPQNRLGRRTYDDPQALRDPRPDIDREESRYGDSIRYEFKDDDESFVVAFGSLGTITHNGDSGTITVRQDGLIPGSKAYIIRGGFFGVPVSIDPSIYTKVVARVKMDRNNRLCTFWWIRGIDGGSISSDRKMFTRDRPFEKIVMGDQWRMLEWDLLGAQNWDDTIVGIQFDFATELNTVTEIDYIRFENPIP